MVENMRRIINRQVQSKVAVAQDEKGTENVNVASGPNAYEVKTLISNTIKEKEGVWFLQSASDHPMFQHQKERDTLHPDRLYLDMASSFNVIGKEGGN